MPSIIDAIHLEYADIASFLDKAGEPSLLSDYNRHFVKLIAIYMGSYFENEIQKILLEFVGNKSENDVRIINFVQKKAIYLQYHTYFSWGEKDRIDKPGKNANAFFAMFGDDFKREIEKDILAAPALDEAVKSFLELGHIRNILVHSNCAAYSFGEITPGDLFNLYVKAQNFIIYLRKKLL